MNEDRDKLRIVRSAKRRKTVSARLVDGIMEVRAPASMSDEELGAIVEKLRKRLESRRIGLTLNDDQLERRANELNKRYFDGKLVWQSIRWVMNQNKRYGSCTPSKGTIRLSHRLAKAPTFVLDYVLVHELAHLIEANHGPGFWKLVNRYPKTERARGYLMALGMEEIDG